MGVVCSGYIWNTIYSDVSLKIYIMASSLLYYFQQWSREVNSKVVIQVVVVLLTK